MAIKHAFESDKADSADATKVRATNWNADHVIEDFETETGDLCWHESDACLALGWNGTFGSEKGKRIDIKHTISDWSLIAGGTYPCVYINVGDYTPDAEFQGTQTKTVYGLNASVKVPYNFGSNGAGIGISGHSVTYDYQISGGSPAVGVFGAGYIGSNPPDGQVSQAWGANFSVLNAGPTTTGAHAEGDGFTNCNIYGVEIDVHCYTRYDPAVVITSIDAAGVIDTAAIHLCSPGDNVMLFNTSSEEHNEVEFAVSAVGSTTELTLSGAPVATATGGTLRKLRECANATGLWITGGSTSAPQGNSDGVFVGMLGAFHEIAWANAFRSLNGAATVGLLLGTAQSTDNPSGGQEIRLTGRSSVGLEQTATIVVDPDANLIFRSGGILAGQVVLQDAGGNAGLSLVTSASSPYINVQNRLSIAKKLDFPQTIVTIASGDNNNVAIGDYTFIKITGPGATFSITGIQGGYDGRIIHLFNTTAQQMVLKNLSGSSTAANQIRTLTGGDVTLRAGLSAATLIYDDDGDTWTLISTN